MMETNRMYMGYIESIILYICTLCITLLIASLYSKKDIDSRLKNMLWIGLICLPFAVLSGLRYCVGTDYETYASLFDYIKGIGLSSALQIKSVEFGFAILVKVLSYINASNLFIFGALQFITLFVALYAISKYKKDISFTFAIFLYYVIVFHFSLNIIRQILAASFILLSICYLLNKKKVKYVASLAIAISVHTSAIICVLFGFVAALMQTKTSVNDDGELILVKTKRIRTYIFLFLIFVSPVLINILIEPILNIPIFRKYAHRINTEGSLGFGTIAYSVLYLLPAIALNKKKIKTNRNLYLLTFIVLLYVSFSFVGYYVEWASRIDIYPLVLFSIYIPLLIGRPIINRGKVSLTLAYYFIFLSGMYVYDIWIRNINETLPFFFFK